MFYSKETGIVKVEDITKIYKLYDKPLDRLKELFLHRPFHKEFVALHGVTFTLEQGETLGIIGDNGAGKSTLLKILSKTLSPTRGRFEVKGLVSSLLELGSGFHPEFTGIENIFFYGSLLGIDNSLMKEKINEIADFAELGDFINYPIKTYSSGMHVRLAFSVATSVNPDILIIDEALSVGDQHFQMKCLEKMDNFKKKGKTIIFCSHDLYQVKSFCEKTLWMDHGQIKMTGQSANVVEAYFQNERLTTERFKTKEILHNGVKNPSSSFLSLHNLSAQQTGKNEVRIEFAVMTSKAFHGHIGWAIATKDLFQASLMTTYMQKREPYYFEATKNITISIRNLNIVNGNYMIYVGIFDKNGYKPITIDSVECAIDTGFEIYNSLCYFDSTFDITDGKHIASP